VSAGVEFDPIRKARHYNVHPSGIEVIEVSRHLPGNLAQAWQYIVRAPYKDDQVKDLRKAAWFLRDHAEHFEELHPDPRPLRLQIHGHALDLPHDVREAAMRVMRHERDDDISRVLMWIIRFGSKSDLFGAATLLDAVAHRLERESVVKEVRESGHGG
jgi:hypothetical protein